MESRKNSNPGAANHVLPMGAMVRKLSDENYKKICGILYDTSRINLSDNKKELVQTRLNKRLRQLGIGCYSDYLKYVEDDKTGKEFSYMVDVLTTNLTFFFREPNHFTFLANKFLKDFMQRPSKRLRIWSAGSSSGEEAYTIAIVLKENIPASHLTDARILATDISHRMIETARAGIYPESRFKSVALEIRNKYFTKLDDPPTHEGPKYKINPEAASLVRFNQMNLMAPWPMNGPFDAIFCRNVMIYFDRNTQAELVARYHAMLRPGGILFVGHSENLTGFKHDFSYVQPSVYMKAETPKPQPS